CDHGTATDLLEASDRRLRTEDRLGSRGSTTCDESDRLCARADERMRQQELARRPKHAAHVEALAHQLSHRARLTENELAVGLDEKVFGLRLPREIVTLEAACEPEDFQHEVERLSRC